MVDTTPIISTIRDYGYPCLWITGLKGHLVARYPATDQDDATVDGAILWFDRDANRLAPGTYNVLIRRTQADNKGGINRTFTIPEQTGANVAGISSGPDWSDKLLAAETARLNAIHAAEIAGLKQGWELEKLKKEVQDIKNGNAGGLGESTQIILAGLAAKLFGLDISSSVAGSSATPAAVAAPEQETSSPEVVRVESAIMDISEILGDARTADLIEQVAQNIKLQHAAQSQQNNAAA